MKIKFKPQKTWITNNFWLKLISLVLAIVIWFYISGELNIIRLGQNFSVIHEPVYNRPKLTNKKVPIVLDLEGELPRGYSLEKNSIKINPEYSIILGKEKLLREFSYVKTQRINVRKFTDTIQLKVSLKKYNDIIIIEPEIVEVTIPIVKKGRSR